MRTIIEIVACLIAGTLLGLITAESVARPRLRKVSSTDSRRIDGTEAHRPVAGVSAQPFVRASMDGG
jgi:hypothetical protein